MSVSLSVSLPLCLLACLSHEESANGCMPQYPIDLSPITIVSQKTNPPLPPILAIFSAGVKMSTHPKVSLVLLMKHTREV